MHSLIARILRCPDCGGSPAGDLRCGGCGRSFAPAADGIIDALPARMERSAVGKEELRTAIEAGGSRARAEGVVLYERAFHDEQAAYYDKMFADPLPLRLYYSRLVGVDIYDRVRQAPFVVDLCCGTGKSSAPLMSRGVTVVGMDVSREMLRVYRAKYPSPMNPILIHADASRPPLQPGSCGALMMVGGLHHIPDPAASLQACSDSLSDEGVLVLHEPLKTGRRSRAGVLLENLYAAMEFSRVRSALARRLGIAGGRAPRADQPKADHPLDFTPFEHPFTSPDELLRTVPPGMRAVVLRPQGHLSFRLFPPALQSRIGRPLAAFIVRLDDWIARAGRAGLSGDALFAVLRKQPAPERPTA
jgi:SAM-dependent methyltransferase